MPVSPVKPGNRFGALVVLARNGDAKHANHYGVMWRCRCDCGREVDIPTTRLTRDKKRYCDVEHHPIERGAMIRAAMIRSKRVAVGRPKSIAPPFRAGGIDDDFEDWNG